VSQAALNPKQQAVPARHGVAQGIEEIHPSLAA